MQIKAKYNSILKWKREREAINEWNTFVYNATGKKKCLLPSTVFHLDGATNQLTFRVHNAFLMQ